MWWQPATFKGKSVHARIDSETGEIWNESGRTPIIYQLQSTAKIYSATTTAIQLQTGDAIELVVSAPPASPSNAAVPSPTNNDIIIYTDGACSGNPGPCGLGVVYRDGDQATHISEFLGEGTNNIGELTAIFRALQQVPSEDVERNIFVHTDSSYSIGVLTKNWKAKANKELIGEIRQLVGTFPHLYFIKVKGHAGIPDNEAADELARLAVETQQSVTTNQS